MSKGYTMENAIQISRDADVQNEISKFLDNVYGQNDGEYFVHASQEYIHQRTQQKYNVCLVEYVENDEEKRVQHWFQVV